jgi:cytochrome b561
MLRNTADSWGAAAKAFHWGMAALILAQLALGLAAASWRLSPTKLELFVWHKSLGMLVLALLVLRVLWRLANSSPALPAALPAWERAAARTSHAALYLLMAALPLTGWVVSSASGIPFRIFWLIPLPSIAPADEALAQAFGRVHGALALSLVAVLALHIGAALRHHFVRRNEVLTRMLPGRRLS